ncbi:MAG: hypothetical protein A2513_10000 [Sulfurimonas sp. RIFOXYD12_FULL_33_39]|uniref:hypothetical protein n=1 Tax=unclassified Sulfurimonas TaxID=2623549 RepID=UPI0008D5FA83|nr:MULTISPECIES: hypothetical protein [unclassified Sulfurimonas]OHE09644.1 MAG: hypothetical protein A2513_10000 [Sulfurimonas sp. RIFOXYD12_FULL_33_39]OHE13848.1 MAG: hypothetical protein A2530_09755 [Sulfurimonas sp. RIFOXYD2_FULL_34_21]DAB27676.1 MAG TPA: hypothetical protein CFH78_06600 [Sulfurimonas sp. UBA10385]
MKKIVFSASLAVLMLNGNASAAEEASQKVKDREHSVRDVIDEVAKPKEKEVSTAENIKHVFKDGTVSGQVRVLYSGYNNNATENQHATAIGGQLKYELAEFKGFNAAVELTTSHDIGFATGDDTKQNSEISSEKGSYTELSQAYINYKNGGLNLRAGRQLIDTPLADSDDIRIILNTFEAYTVTYENDGLMLMGGLLTKWQGTDAGLSVDNPWSKTGEDGTYFTGVSYSTDFIDTSLWYYDISKDTNPNSATGNVANKSAYADISLHMALSKDYALHTSAQYINQRESDNSGIDSSIYGAMAELVMFEDFSLSAAYNNSKKQAGKGSFSGFGGGTLYTNMDSMIIDAITTDRDVNAIVAGITYTVGDFGFMYAYGDFKGDEDSLGAKEHIVEQNVGFEYTPNENLTIAAIYVKDDDKQNSGSNGGDWENIRALVSYSF